MKEHFDGEIKVASRIIDYLSSGLYKDPASCLKELINNSYDADATRVDIFVKPDADRIIVADNGEGISKNEFVTHFKRISESHKRDSTDVTASGRKKIGKIGIGFIAANELCDKMEVFSTKKGSKELLHVTINFSDMRTPPEEREETSGDVKKADYVGEVLEEDEGEHYTQIFLNKVRGEARDILVGAVSQKEDGNVKSLYGLNRHSIEKKLKSKTIKEWKEFDAYSETMLKVALNIPVAYHDNWIPGEVKKKVRTYEKHLEDNNFVVYYDGCELRKPVVYNPDDKKYFVDTFEYEGEEVSLKGYFYVQHGVIKPFELHGVLLRIRDAAVGEYNQQFLNFPTSEHGLIQRWVSCEIWADDRLENAMNIDRVMMRDTHPAYVEFRKVFHAELRKVLRKALKEIYESGRDEKNEKSRHDTAISIKKIISNTVTPISKDVAKDISTYISSYENDKKSKVLTKKYSATELFEIVSEVAADTLTPAQLEKFMRELTKRLGE